MKENGENNSTRGEFSCWSVLTLNEVIGASCPSKVSTIYYSLLVFV